MYYIFTFHSPNDIFWTFENKLSRISFAVHNQTLKKKKKMFVSTLKIVSICLSPRDDIYVSTYKYPCFLSFECCLHFYFIANIKSYELKKTIYRYNLIKSWFLLYRVHFWTVIEILRYLCAPNTYFYTPKHGISKRCFI